MVEGRDIGTVVFPNAEAKFFLTATADERARRRVAELRAAGKPAEQEKTRAEIIARDERDSTRAAAPLRRADDAIEIDSSALGPDEVVSKMATMVAEIVNARATGIRQGPEPAPELRIALRTLALTGSGCVDIPQARR